jgi:hypothetical protein
MIGAFIAISIVLIVICGTTLSLVSWFRLQRHRADAVAMAGYRKLAEQAVARQEELTGQLTELSTRLASVEHLLKDVQ